MMYCPVIYSCRNGRYTPKFVKDTNYYLIQNENLKCLNNLNSVCLTRFILDIPFQ